MRFHEIIAERQQQLYLRLGDLPEGGKSAIGAAPNIYKHIARNGATHEAGVSVYPVEWDPEINRFVIDCNNYASLNGLFGQRRPAYLVTGKEIGKYGMDDEPLLRNVKIVKQVPYDQLNVPGWGSTPQPEDFLIDYAHNELDEAANYPLADRGEWYGNANFADHGGKIVKMSPDEYLSKVRPLVIDDASRDNIDDLKQHMESGRTLDPLIIYPDGKEDGRHRAIAAKELGITQVPVIVFNGLEEDASPGVFYHSGDPSITKFWPWTHFGTKVAAKQRKSDRGQEAKTYAVHLHINHPLKVTDMEASDEAALLNAIAAGRYPKIDVGLARREGVIAACEKAGYDGLAYRNGMEHRGSLSWVIFHPEQAQLVNIDEDASDPAFRPVKNPTDRQIAQMVQRAKQHRLRGIVYGQDFWLWDAYYAIHKQAADAIGVPYWPDGKDNRIAVNDEDGYPVFDFPSDDLSIQELLMSRFKNSDDIFFQCGSHGLLSGKEAAELYT